MQKLSFLILSIIFLAALIATFGCAGNVSPIDKVTIVDWDQKEGTVFKYKNIKKLEVFPKPVGRVPLPDLHGYVCLSPLEYLELKYWVIDLIQETEMKRKLYQCEY